MVFHNSSSIVFYVYFRILIRSKLLVLATKNKSKKVFVFINISILLIILRYLNSFLFIIIRNSKYPYYSFENIGAYLGIKYAQVEMVSEFN